MNNWSDLSHREPVDRSVFRRYGLLMLACCLSFNSIGRSPAWAQQNPPYRFERDIQLPQREQTELVTFRLDTDIYAQTQPTLADLRLVDQAGLTVPFIVRPCRETEPRIVTTTWPAENVSLKPADDNGLEVRFTLDDEDRAPTGLKIVTPLKNFEQRINLFAIDASGQDTQLVTDEVIFDYSEYMDVRSVTIAFPQTDARSFRIHIDSPTTRQQSALSELTEQLTGDQQTSRQLRTVIIDRPFRIDRIELLAENEQTQSGNIKTVPYELDSVTSEVNSQTNQTIVHIESQSQPLTQLQVITNDKNFQRSARLYAINAPNDNEPPEYIAETVLMNLDVQGIKKNELTVQFPANRRSRYQLVIDNGDNPPLKVDQIQAAGRIDEIVFVAEQDSQYALQYGNEHLEQLDLDTATVQALLAEDIVPIQAQLSTEQTLIASQRQPAVTFGDLISNPYLIGTLIALMIVSLILLLYAAAKKIDQLPDE